MKQPYRRLCFAALYLALLIAVAYGAAFLGRNFTGSGPVPTRTAFAGRLPNQREGDRNRYQLFYATNRDTNDEATFGARGSKLGNEVAFGTFDVLIAPRTPIVPWVWLDKNYIKWDHNEPRPEEELLAQLREAVQASPKKSLLVIVWGFRDWFQSAALKTAYTAFVLDINTPVLLFDWPGNQGEGSGGYRASVEVASKSAPDLGRILGLVTRETGAEKVWLMGSSLGCQTICDSFDWLDSHPDIFEGLPKIDHVVLSAPDVCAGEFDEKFAERIKALSNHLTAYVSSNDRALLMSHWLNRGRRLGRLAEVSRPPEDRTGAYQFEEAEELLDLQEKGLIDSCIVDATPINRTRNLHHFFTDSPEFFDDLYRQLLQPKNNLSRRLHAVQPGSSRNYWILWND